MSVAETLSQSLGFDPETGMIAALWFGAALTALVLIFGVKVFGPPILPGLPGPATTVARYAAVFLALLVGLSFLDREIVRDRAELRRSLEMRANALTARAIAPGSPLACLDASAGEIVEAACEAALFAKPETVAAAVSYVIARLTLLSDGAELANRGDDGYDTILADLRRSAETDRFGFVSHVLASRDNCTPERCAAYNLMNDSSRVRANLRAQLFEKHLASHVAAWKAAPDSAPRAVEERPSPPATGSVGNNWNFPSAASIPPVSIMTNEPASPVTSVPNNPAATAPQAAPNSPAEANAAPTPPRRPSNAPPRRPASTAANPPPNTVPSQPGPLPPPPPLPPAANASAPPPR